MTSIDSTSLQDRLKLFNILAPVDPEANARWRTAPKLVDLHGKVGGFLGNRKHNASPLLAGVREALDKRFELRDTFSQDKLIYSRPASPEIIDTLAERCDFVITAIAD